MEGGIGRVARLALEALFPRFCLRCRKEGTYWCRACEESNVLWRYEECCPFCETQGSNRVCASCAEETFLDGVFAATAYANPVVREAVAVWKYHSVGEVGEVICRWVRQACGNVQMFEGDFAVAHVPLHVYRVRARGFDQAQRIAQTVAAAFNQEPLELLERMVPTSAQAQSSSSERVIGDMDGIFRVRSPVPPCVVLCDDVFTSGATMDAAAKVLKEHGAREVWGFVLAKS